MNTGDAERHGMHSHAEHGNDQYITNALYLLVQDGCDLLEAAQTGMMQLTTTDAVKRTPPEQSQS
jgi:hypothetical protein